MRAIAAIIISLSLMLATSCSDATSGEYASRPHGTVSIAHLKTMATTTSRLITDDISIEGYVVVNDLFGEYYKSIVISDESGGIEICVNSDHTATDFPVSARIVVQCSGLAVGSYGGRVMLGAAPQREYTVDRIAESDFCRYFIVDCNNPYAPQPTPITIAELNASHISNYVSISDVSFTTQSGMRWCDKDPIGGDYISTERTATDQNGDTITIRTIAGCTYADEIIPDGNGTLYGIVEYFNGSYALRIVNHGIDF